MPHNKNQSLTPQQIVNALDEYIIGQKEAKRSVAIAFRGRWRRQHADQEIGKEIMPNNILMKGSTGTGKTEVGRRLAKLCNAPFIKVEATRYTEEGYVGRNVDSMIQELAQKSLSMVKAEKQEILEKQAKERVDIMILDILIPPMVEENASQEGQSESVNMNQDTRNRFLNKIRSGELDSRMIEIRVEDKGPNIIGGLIDDNNMMALQDMMSKIVPRKNKKRKVTVANARKILLDQELERLLDMDMDNIKKEAVERAKTGIVFIDEIDKIAANYTKTGPDVSREGVQRNLLPIIEGSIVTTRIGPIPTDHILFIAAGAFHNSQPSDLMPELQGRFPIRVAFHNLTESDFYHILQAPKNSITKQQEALFAAEKVTLTFTDDAIKALAKAAYMLNQDREDIGARRLRTVMVCVLDDYAFDVPDKVKPGSKIVIDADLVNKKLGSLMKKEESSKYIL